MERFLTNGPIYVGTTCLYMCGLSLYNDFKCFILMWFACKTYLCSIVLYLAQHTAYIYIERERERNNLGGRSATVITTLQQ